MEVRTPENYMAELKWAENDLKLAKIFLAEWDKRDSKYYTEMKISKTSIRVDKAEREHYRNCVNYWEDKLNDAMDIG